MDVQYGIWTDVPNKDVLWTSRGRAMFIGDQGFSGSWLFMGQIFLSPGFLGSRICVHILEVNIEADMVFFNHYVSFVSELLTEFFSVYK